MAELRHRTFVRMAERHLSEDMEGFADFAALEVDSVVELIVPIANEMLYPELAGVQHVFGAVAGQAGSGVGPLRETETGAPVEADAWHHDFCCGCGGRQVGLRQRSQLLTVTWLVSQYRACQVASPSWTDRQTEIWRCDASLTPLVLGHVTASPRDQQTRSRLSRLTLCN